MNTYKILIADDDNVAIMVIDAMLKINGNYNIITASNGLEAVDKTLTEKPDLILMDWQMPYKTGLEALKEIKTHSHLASIPIIMQTCMTASENLQEALAAGAVDYIKKPIDKIELISRVKSALLLYNSLRKIQRQNQMISVQMEQLSKLSVVAKETDNSVLILSKEGEIEWVNEGFVRLYGYSMEEYKLKYGKQIFASNKQIKINQLLKKVISTKKSVDCETYNQTYNGEYKWVHTKLNPIFSSNNQIQKFVAVEIDITKLKKTQEELKQKNQGLVTLAQYLQEINKNLEDQYKEIAREKKIIEEEKKQIELEKLEVEQEKQLTDKVLENILPQEITTQLKATGSVRPRFYKKASVLFTDFKGFTKSCEKLSPKQIVDALHQYFVRFDEIIAKHYIEKIKTIGDAYMCVGGLPIRNRSHPFDIVLAGLEMQNFINNLDHSDKTKDLPFRDLRLGIHTGPVVAGVVGKIKFAYDIWGDSVNIASRMESSGEPGKVNISGETYEYIKDYFDCTYRGKIEAKNKGKIDMYFVNGLKDKYTEDQNKITPNTEFRLMLSRL